MDNIECVADNSSTEIFFSVDFKIPQIYNSEGIYVCDTNSYKLISNFFKENTPKDNIIILPAGESSKNLDSICKILDKAQEMGLARDSLFVGVGGGVITDMTAFAASIYMRGANLALVPTSLLAMVDASVGGKTGIDYGTYKNSVGSFYPARSIYIGIKALDTLPEYEYFCGFGEVVKMAMLYDQNLFELLKTEANSLKNQAKPGQTKNYELLQEIIKRCVQAKCDIVEKDLKESGLRMQLNLGHTFAHSLETFLGLGTISHGEAVAWGLSRAIKLGEVLGITNKEYVKSVFDLLNSYGWSTTPIHPLAKKKAAELKLSDENLAIELTKLMEKDKKKRNSVVKFIIQEDICKNLIMEVPMSSVMQVLHE